MTYFITTILFALGVGYHVMQVIQRLRRKFPDKGFREIFDTYFREEWDSLIRSGLVWATYELFLFVLDKSEAVMPLWWEKYFAAYALAVVLGYAGQRLAYKYLGTAEKVLSEKAEKP